MELQSLFSAPAAEVASQNLKSLLSTTASIPTTDTRTNVGDICEDGAEKKKRLLYSLEDRPPTLIAICLVLQVCSSPPIDLIKNHRIL